MSPTPKTWQLLPTISAPMPVQMALDELHFRQMESQEALACEPIFRFYYSSEPWLSVGYSHPEDQMPQNQLVCKRITGGGVVHHGKDLIFSLVAKKRHDESFASVRMSYLKLHEAVKAALEALGLRPRFYRCDEKLPRGKECFDYPIATDLGIDQQKIAGGSQKRSTGTLLHQESIQLIKNLEAQALIAEIIHGVELIFKVKLTQKDLCPHLFQNAVDLTSASQKKILMSNIA